MKEMLDSITFTVLFKLNTLNIVETDYFVVKFAGVKNGIVLLEVFLVGM